MLDLLLLLVTLALCTLALLLGAIIHAIRKHSTPHHVSTTYLQSLAVPSTSLFSYFQPHLVPIPTLAARGYSPVLSLTQSMIGIQPVCDSVLEIWPPAFECYNILPNSLNVPQMLLGAGGKDVMDARRLSLAMYASSRANECAYCTSHCCSFALRRGVDPRTLRNVPKEAEEGRRKKVAKENGGSSNVGGEDGSDGDGITNTATLPPQESTIIQFAYGLGTVPCSLATQTVRDMQSLFSPSQLEWAVASTAIFGMYNKLMDGLNVPLETSTYQETADALDDGYTLGKAADGMISQEDAASTGGGGGGDARKKRLPPPPKDDWTTIVAVLYQALRPGGVLALDKKLLRDIPTTARDCGTYLYEFCGCAFASVLEWITHDRFRRAVCGVIGKNFLSDNLRLRLKARVGLVYCEMLENDVLAKELKKVLVFSQQQNPVGAGEGDDLILRIGKALSYAPSRMTPELVNELHASKEVKPPMVVELVTFLAVLQTLHRIISFRVVQERARKEEGEGG